MEDRGRLTDRENGKWIGTVNRGRQTIGQRIGMEDRGGQTDGKNGKRIGTVNRGR